jgi:hypothetical protein
MKKGIKTWTMQTILNLTYSLIHFLMLLEVGYENS